MARRITDIVNEGEALGVVAGVAASVPVADDQTAAQVPFTPAGTIAATNVQDALVELDTEKSPLTVPLANLAGAGVAADGQVPTADGLGGVAWEIPAGGAGSGVDTVSIAYSASNLTVNSANWAEVAAATGGPGTGGFDLTLSGVTAGDKIICGLSSLWGNQAPQTHMDVVTVVGTTVTNSFAEAGAAVTAPGKSITAWAAVGAAFHSIGGTSMPYTTVAGDLSAGSLILRLRYGQTGGAGARTLYASATLPLHFWAINLGQ